MNFEEIYNIVANKLQIPEEVRRNVNVQNFVFGTLMYVEQNIKKVSVTRKEDVNFLQGTIGDIDEWMKRSIAQEMGYYLYKKNLIDFQIEQNNTFQRKYTANLQVVKYVDIELNEEQLKQKRLELQQQILQKLSAEVVDYEELEHLHNMVVDNESQMNIAQEEADDYYIGVDLAENGKDFTSIVDLNGDGC